VLAHALHLRAIHGGKNKNDRIDSEKLVRLLAAHLIPIAYVYPAAKRPVRALLRQRLAYVWRRSELLMRVQSMQQAEGHAPVPAARAGIASPGQRACSRSSPTRTTSARSRPTWPPSVITTA
jgi:hypothetical protein